MMYRLSLCLLACLFLLPSPAKAEDLLMHDSVYYTMDDGIMSPEEMELEAGQIFQMCQMNHFQKTNYDCECLAGAFLIQREKLGPMVPQSQIFDDLTLKNPVSECADTVSIAGTTYSMCLRQNGQRRAANNDAPEYCGCVANKVALDFKKRPRLTPGYVQSLTYNSMVHCNNPENRPKTASSEGAKTAN